MKTDSKAPLFSIFVAFILLVFLFIIMAFIWYDVLDLTAAGNFMIGMCFWIINCIILVMVFPVKMFLVKDFPMGYYATIVMVTIIYTLLIWMLMGLALLVVSKTIFVLINLIILFLYLMIVLPLTISGLNK